MKLGGAVAIAWAMVGATVLSTITLVFLGFEALEAIRAVIGIAFVVILPGGAIAIAAFRPGSLRSEETVLLALGLSVSLAILLGLGFASLGILIAFGPWVVALAVISVVAGVIGVRRQRAASRPAGILRVSPSLPVVRVAALALAGVLAVSAVVIARGGAFGQAYPAFSSLSMVSDGGAALRISVTNHEAESTSYLVVLASGNVTLGNWTTGELAPGQTWTNAADLPAQTASATATLARAADPQTVYRRVSWVAEPGPPATADPAGP